MIIKVEHKYTLDDDISYSLIDNIDKIDVGYDNKKNLNYINYYKNNRKDLFDYSTIYADNSIIYVMNNENKTLQIIRPDK